MMLICVSRSSSVCPSGLPLRPSFLYPFRAMLTRSILFVSQLPKYLCSRRRNINTLVPLGRGNLKMQRAKKGAASEGQVPAQKEVAESPSSMEQLLKAMEKMKESMDKRFLELSDRIETLEPNQRFSVRNTGSQDEKSGERDNHVTEVGGQEITPPEQKRGRKHRRGTDRGGFFKWSSRGSNHRHRRLPNHRHYHTINHSPSLPQKLFWLADSTDLFLPWLENMHTDPSRCWN